MRQALKKKINNLKQLKESQAPLEEQVKYLKILAGKFGLKEAVNFLEDIKKYSEVYRKIDRNVKTDSIDTEKVNIKVNVDGTQGMTRGII